MPGADGLGKQPVSDELGNGSRWYALRTRSRHEKRVRDQLMARGIEPFLPLWEHWSQWKDRRKLIQVPLFPGYCFAQFSLSQKLLVVKTPGVVSIVGLNRVPVPVPDQEISAIQRLVQSTLRYDPCPFLKEGMLVEVTRGPLIGIRGILVRKARHGRLVLKVGLIRQAAAVEIDAGDVTPV